MEKRSSRDILLSIIGVLILVVAVVGISYAIWSKTIFGDKDNSIRTGYVNFSYIEDSNGISLDNAIPMNDETGKALNGDKNEFDFTISSSLITNGNPLSYQILAVQNSENTLEEKYIKVYLTDDDDNPVGNYDSEIIPTYDSLNNNSDNSAKILYNSTIESSISKKFRLRIWLSSDYNLSTIAKSFSFKVNVKGEI